MQYNNNNTQVLWSVLLIVCCTGLLTAAVGASETEDMQNIRTPPHRQRTHYNKNHNHNHHRQHHNHQQQRQHQHHQHHNQQQQQQEQEHSSVQQRRQQRRLDTLQQLKSDVELLPGVTMPPPVARKNATTTTRLRRVYNRLHTRNFHGQRSNNEWDYNFYTNTFGPVAPPAGKGDDNLHDVEFIGTGAGTARGYDYVPPQSPATQPPTTYHHRRAAMPTLGSVPPLVPARRGYATAAPRRSDNDLPPALTPTPTTTTTTTTTTSTDNPYETNTINRNYPNDPKDMERRHICVQQRTITMPFKTTEVYTRPTWKHISTPCQPPTHTNQMCTRVQLVHEQAYRDVIRHKSAQQVTYDCCTGWTRETPHADACMKPICGAQCQNGGTCEGPDKCSCPAGYTGRYCEQDVNECKEEKPCDQTCINTVGSYYCRCREGFVLQADQQSCKKTDLHADDAFEARDLENDIDSGDEMTSRLQKIERSLANERVHTHELQRSLQATHNVVDTLKSRLSSLEKQQHDFHRLQTNLYQTESRTNKLEGMLNLLMKCRNGPNANCP